MLEIKLVHENTIACAHPDEGIVTRASCPDVRAIKSEPAGRISNRERALDLAVARPDRCHTVTDRIADPHFCPVEVKAPGYVPTATLPSSAPSLTRSLLTLSTLLATQRSVPSKRTPFGSGRCWLFRTAYCALVILLTVLVFQFATQMLVPSKRTLAGWRWRLNARATTPFFARTPTRVLSLAQPAQTFTPSKANGAEW